MKRDQSIGFFILGCGILFMALCRSFWFLDIDSISITIALSGLALLLLFLFLWRAEHPMEQGFNFFSVRNVFFMILEVVCVVAVLAGVNVLAYRHDIRWDATRFAQHTVTDSTKDLLTQLSVPVKMTVFYPGLPPKYLLDLLDSYERYAPAFIETKIIDPIVDIAYAARFGDTISSEENKVIIESDQQRRDVDFTQAPLNEELLNNAIIRVTRTERQICFVTGHNEYELASEKDKGFKTFAEILLRANIKVKEIFLDQEQGIASDCDAVLVAGSRQLWPNQHHQWMNDYLKAGGDALFLIEHVVVAEPGQDIAQDDLMLHPSLNEILNPWGIDIQQDIVVDLKSNVGDVGSPATRNYLPHKMIVNDLDYTFFVRPRSIKQITPQWKDVKTAPLFSTHSSDSSWGETNRNLQVQYDEGLDFQGPVPLGYVVFRPPTKDEASGTRIIVITDADFLSNIFIKQFSNAQLGLQTIQWLTELEYQPLPISDNVEVARLDLTSQQKRMVLILLMLMPLGLLVGGVSVFLRRIW